MNEGTITREVNGGRMVRIKSISIVSAFKIAAAISALLWVIFGGLLFVFPTILFFDAASFSGSVTTVDAIEFTGLSLLFIFVCGVPIYAIIGGISGAVTALVYNLVASAIGGLEVQLEESLNVPGSQRTVGIPGRPSPDYDAPNKTKNDSDPFGSY